MSKKDQDAQFQKEGNILTHHGPDLKKEKWGKGDVFLYFCRFPNKVELPITTDGYCDHIPVPK